MSKDNARVYGKVVGSSPDPKIVKSIPKEIIQMTFFEALKKLSEGSKITKLEWGNTKEYGLLRDGRVQLHKSDDLFYQWIISDGDLNGKDWITI